MQAIKEAYTRYMQGQSQGTPQGTAPQPSPNAPQGQPSGMSAMMGGAEGVAPGAGAVSPDFEIQKIAAQALAKRLNQAAKVGV